jgi:hypothetical protein
MAATLADMGKKKGSGQPEKPAKSVLYLEIDAVLKDRLVRLADLHSRKITAEGVLAIRRYVEEEERKEGLPPLGPTGKGGTGH